MDEILNRQLLEERALAAQNVAWDDELEMWARQRAWSLFMHWQETLDLLDGKFEGQGQYDDSIPLVS